MHQRYARVKLKIQLYYYVPCYKEQSPLLLIYQVDMTIKLI